MSLFSEIKMACCEPYPSNENNSSSGSDGVSFTTTNPYSNDCYLETNETSPVVLPPYMIEISDLNKYCIAVYALLFILAAAGNVSILSKLGQRVRFGRGRTDLLFVHLCIADLSVTFLLMPVEILWRITIAWKGSDILCKVCQFARAFGLYLSSNVVVSISIDRYYAIMYPLKFAGAKTRVKGMLFAAWIVSVLFASSQMFIYHVVNHPLYPDFQQCVTRAFITTDLYNELMYNVVSLSALYFIPLLVIIYTSTRILWKINKRSKEHEAARQQETSEAESNSRSRSPQSQNEPSSTPTRSMGFINQLETVTFLWSSKRNADAQANVCTLPVLRSSANQTVALTKARVKTLRLTLLILVTFIACWTPYSIMTLWYMVDRQGASQVDERLQEVLFLMAVTNSVLNPLIYSSFRRKQGNPMSHH